MNCLEHSDPGLFVLSLSSSSAGLQLKDHATDTWVDSPIDQNEIGILWAGDSAVKASNGKIKPGIHRVLYGNKPRISLWHEINTADQVPEANHIRGLKQRQLSIFEYLKEYFLHEIATGIPPTKRRLRGEEARNMRLKHFDAWVQGKQSLPRWLSKKY